MTSVNLSPRSQWSAIGEQYDRAYRAYTKADYREALQLDTAATQRFYSMPADQRAEILQHAEIFSRCVCCIKYCTYKPPEQRAGEMVSQILRQSIRVYCNRTIPKVAEAAKWRQIAEHFRAEDEQMRLNATKAMTESLPVEQLALVIRGTLELGRSNPVLSSPSMQNNDHLGYRGMAAAIETYLNLAMSTGLDFPMGFFTRTEFPELPQAFANDMLVVSGNVSSLADAQIILLGNIHTDEKMGEAAHRFVAEYAKDGDIFLVEGSRNFAVSTTLFALKHFKGKRLQVFGWDNYIAFHLCSAYLAVQKPLEEEWHKIKKIINELSAQGQNLSQQAQRLVALTVKINQIRSSFAPLKEQWILERDQSALCNLRNFQALAPNQRIFLYGGDAHIESLLRRSFLPPLTCGIYFKKSKEPSVEQALEHRKPLSNEKDARTPREELNVDIRLQRLAEQIDQAAKNLKLFSAEVSEEAGAKVSHLIGDEHERALYTWNRTIKLVGPASAYNPPHEIAKIEHLKTPAVEAEMARSLGASQ